MPSVNIWLWIPRWEGSGQDNEPSVTAYSTKSAAYNRLPDDAVSVRSVYNDNGTLITEEFVSASLPGQTYVIQRVALHS